MNIKKFFQAPDKYTKSEPKNPLDYAEYGKKVWDERDGSYIRQNYNYRRMLLCTILTILVLAGGLVFQSLRSTVEPYIIEVDKSTGAIKNVGIVKDINYKPSELEVQYFLGQFIKNTRTIPLDPVVLKKQWEDAYNYLSHDAQVKMNAEMENNGLMSMIGKKTVQPKIVSILPLNNSKTSYQIRWNEQVVDMSSGAKTEVPMTAIISYTQSSPDSQDEYMVNPLGLYITDFQWSKDNTEN